MGPENQNMSSRIDERRKLVGAILVKARKRRRMRLQDVSEATGLHRSSISRLENGRQHIDVVMLNALAHAFGLQPRTLGDAILKALETYEREGFEAAVVECRFPEIDPGVGEPDTRAVIGMGNIPVSMIVAGDSQSPIEWDAVEGEVLDLGRVEAAEVKGESMEPVAFTGQKILFIREWPGDGELCVCSIGGKQYFKRYYERIMDTRNRGRKVIVSLVNISQDPTERPMPELDASEIDWCYTVVGTWLR